MFRCSVVNDGLLEASSRACRAHFANLLNEADTEAKTFEMERIKQLQGKRKWC